ncbi:MFS transporter [Speluncibacter jeojiensis]|uniref:MFS transporter n=1 Tax=Speluncibacter jeojiensis TaxID=2710754 RepID=A0A9X4REZ2_9ACTN|nr:MFS transporter [Rhodococcus sp. D2-41]MDG3016385.1 MFS transporter [Corynebacteriales bacterium D3-21]
MTALLLALMMINFGDKAVLGLAANDIRHEFGLSAAQYGTIASGFFLLFSISALAVGFIADRFATKPVLLVLAVVWAVALLPVLGAAGFGVLLASRIVLGAAEGPAFGVANHAVQKWFVDADRNVPAALLSLGPALGVMVAAPTLTWLMVHHGWRSMFVALIVAGVVWAVVWAVAGREGPLGAHSHGTAEPASAEGVEDVPAVSALRVLSTGTWIGCSIAVFAAYWSLSLVVSWLPPYLTNGAGYSKSQTGLLTALPWVAGAVAVVAQGVVTQRLMKRGVSARWARGALGGGVVIAAGVCTWAFVHVPNGPMKLALMALGLGISGVIFTVATTACGQISPARSRGAVLGAFVAVYSLAGVAAPFVTGRLVGDAGSAPIHGYDTVFMLTGIILVVGGIAAVALIRPERDAARLRTRATTSSRHCAN